MKLKELKLENFRGYNGKISIPIDNGLTAFIGKNDIGKSTILEALEIFFNNKSVKIENADLNINSSSDEIRISCVFKDLPEAINIDSENTTTLQEEYLLNENNDLEILKEFKCSGKNPSESVYIHANFPNHKDYLNILEKTNSDLKKLAKDLTVADQRKNAELRKAIRNNIGDLEIKPTDIPVKKGDSKNIWDKLSSQLPLYALFKSDRSSSDQDSEVQDPMKLAVDIALKEVQSKLDEIKEQVQEQAMKVANRTLSKLQEMDENLASDLIPQFKDDPKWSGIFKLSLNSENNIPLNKRGSGVRRLILLNFFRAEAERLKEEKKVPNIIFAFEEPETSQHPSNQELILNSLLEIAETGKSQVLLTTHVPALASLLPLDSLRFIETDDLTTERTIKLPSEQTFRKIVESLGILPYEETAKAKAIVMVEGYSDVIFLRHSAKVLKDSNHISHNLEDKGILPLIIGGCGNLKHWINLKLLDDLNKPYCVFLDSDKQSNTDVPGNTKAIKDMQEKGVKIFFTMKREIENYICPSLVEDIDEITDYDDIKKLSIKYGKYILEKCWPNMTSEKLLTRDIYTDSSGNEIHELPNLINEIIRYLAV